MQAEWTLQVEQRIEQLRMAFSLLDIEGMVSLYILSNENGSLGRKVREQGTPVLVQGEVGAAHSVATRGLEVTGARPSDSRAAIILFVERITLCVIWAKARCSLLNSALLGYLPTLYHLSHLWQSHLWSFSWQYWGCLLLYPQVSSSILLRQS